MPSDFTFRRLEALRDLGFCPSAVLDIGASCGIWTRKCLRVFPRAMYYCIEPLEEHRQSLLRLSLDYPNVHFFSVAAGPSVGKVNLNVAGDGSSVLAGHWGNVYGVQREVEMTTLDFLLEQGKISPPQLIKRPLDGALGQADLLFMKANSPFRGSNRWDVDSEF